MFVGLSRCHAAMQLSSNQMLSVSAFLSFSFPSPQTIKANMSKGTARQDIMASHHAFAPIEVALAAKACAFQRSKLNACRVGTNTFNHGQQEAEETTATNTGNTAGSNTTTETPSPEGRVVSLCLNDTQCVLLPSLLCPCHITPPPHMRTHMSLYSISM